MESIKFKREHEVLAQRHGMTTKGLPGLMEKSQHGYEMTKRDLTTVPMNRKAIPLT